MKSSQSKTRQFTLGIAVSMVVVSVIACPVLVQAQRAFGSSNQNPDVTEVHVLPVQGNVYLLAGAGGNITAQIGQDGILLVDAGNIEMAPKTMAALRTISNKPIRMIINTHAHRDHTGGNEALAQSGSVIAGGNVANDLSDASNQAAILAHLNVLKVLSATPDTSKKFGAWPTDTFFGDEKKIYFNGEGVDIIHIPEAHSSGDSMVWFRRSDVISTGDILNLRNYPAYDAHEGSIQGVLASLNRLLDISIPAEKEEGGTVFIPGHGRLCDQADVTEYRDMIAIIQSRIRDLINKGMSLEQVKTAKPTRDFDPLYATSSGPAAADNFVEEIYRSLSKSK
jgi:cyclase